MSILHSVILGIVQGLGEFLPISSSAHLIVIPWLLGWPEHTLAFDVALHLGTLLAVLIYFWRDFFAIIVNGLSKPGTEEGKVLWMIALATIPGALFGVLFDKYVEQVLRTQILLIAVMLSVLGIILYLADRYGKKENPLEKMNFARAGIIGLAQAFAIFPGISRSGITITTALLLGFEREAAAKFSFLLSAPIIFGAGFYSLLKNIHSVGAEWLTFSTGIISSAIVGFLAIHFLLGYLKRHDYKVFSVYRILLTALIVIVYLLR